MSTAVLSVIFVVAFVAYLMRRRARLQKEDDL